MNATDGPRHGRLLDSARQQQGLSQRDAARRAGISDGRWRQIVSGVQKVGGGVEVPVNPKPSTLAAMARAVSADVAEVLAAAGFDATVGDDEHDAGHGGYVAAPGDHEPAGVSDSEVLRELRAVREELRAVSERLANVERDKT